MLIYVSISPQTPLSSRLPRDTGQSSLCYITGPCWLSVWNIAVFTCPSQTQVRSFDMAGSHLKSKHLGLGSIRIVFRSLHISYSTIPLIWINEFSMGPGRVYSEMISRSSPSAWGQQKERWWKFPRNCAWAALSLSESAACLKNIPDISFDIYKLPLQKHSCVHILCCVRWPCFFFLRKTPFGTIAATV